MTWVRPQSSRAQEFHALFAVLVACGCRVAVVRERGKLGCQRTQTSPELMRAHGHKGTQAAFLHTDCGPAESTGFVALQRVGAGLYAISAIAALARCCDHMVSTWANLGQGRQAVAGGG